MRSAPSASSAPRIEAGPAVSPACGTERSPASRASSKIDAYGSGGCVSSPPSPTPKTPAHDVDRQLTLHAVLALALHEALEDALDHRLPVLEPVRVVGER